MIERHPIVLVVEDERAVLRINARILTRQGYVVYTAETCQMAYAQLESVYPDLLVLDIMLPDGSGYEICDRFRSYSDHPVIFLTGKDEIHDKIQGLERGGDYYLTKPYDPKELLAVADRLIRRYLEIKQKREELTTIVKGPLILDLANKRVMVNGVDAGLTAKEFALLLHLIQREDQEISASELYETVWGTPAGTDTRTIRFHMMNLRKKLRADETDAYDIVSVYRKGYMFTMK